MDKQMNYKFIYTPMYDKQNWNVIIRGIVWTSRFDKSFSANKGENDYLLYIYIPGDQYNLQSNVLSLPAADVNPNVYLWFWSDN